MSEYISELAHLLVDAALTRRQSDIVAEVALPFPLLVTAKWLGIPEADARKLAEPASAWAGLSGSPISTVALQDEVERYFLEFLLQTKGEGWSETTDALLSRLKRGGINTLRGCAVTLGHLFTSGLFTTSNTLALTFLALARYPDQREELIASDRIGLSKAVDEFLRFTCVPRHSVLRTTTTEIEVGGETLPVGIGIIASVAAANRDPDVFSNAETLDLTRSPNRHLTFAPGTHGCVGSLLARTELGAIICAVRDHPRSRGSWLVEECDHRFGTTLTVDRLVVRID